MTKQKIYSFPEREFANYGEEPIEWEVGNLIDNILTVDSDGNYHLYKECPLNCWTSCWLRLSGTKEEIWNYWHQFIERGEQDEY